VLRGRLPSLLAVCLAVACALGTVIGGERVAHADDQIAVLTKTISSSSSDKTRLAAVVALARLGDKRALKPLVTALHDPSAAVRAAAAVALGQLGHKAALPSLRDLAQNDPDDTVRAKAKSAATSVAKANNLSDEPISKAVQTEDVPKAKKGPRDGGFGHSPHAVNDHPDVYVLVKTSSDDSPGNSNKDARKTHGDIIRQTLMDSFKAQPTVTTQAAEAQKWDLSARQVDLSVVKLEVAQSGGYMEVEAQLRLAISDDKGRMQSFLSGGAKVSIPRSKYDAKNLPALRREALENAMRGMFDKLLAQLKKPVA
jgi:hypothetical protein